eukprot:19168-Chlamydomonas_euryale.AAC.2
MNPLTCTPPLIAYPTPPAHTHPHHPHTPHPRVPTFDVAVDAVFVVQVGERTEHAMQHVRDAVFVERLQVEQVAHRAREQLHDDEQLGGAWLQH